MWLDFVGGILSFAQLMLEALVLHDSSLVLGDPVKLLLALISIAYDVVLMLQHFVLYPSKGEMGLDGSTAVQAKDSEEEELHNDGRRLL